MVMVRKKDQLDKDTMDLVRFERPTAARNAKFQKVQGETAGQGSDSIETETGNRERVEEGIVQPAFRTYLNAREGLAEAFREGPRPAYLTYLEARRNVVDAFKQRVRQDQEICREAEWRYQICQSAIDKAIKVREEGEQDAIDAYRDDVHKAVKRAVNKASKAYKGRMEQLAIECHQSVMDAWRESMETSSQVAISFEQDKIIGPQQDEVLQLQSKRGFLTAIKRMVSRRPVYVSGQQRNGDYEVNNRAML